MSIIEFLESQFSKYTIGNRISSKSLEKIKNNLLEFSQFEDVDSLEIINAPILEVDGKVATVKTQKLIESLRCKGKCYLYQIVKNPPIYFYEDNIIKDEEEIFIRMYCKNIEYLN